MRKMLIVGGGAAGMMCAYHAADRYEVTILEQNERLGKKLFITGKGRCNLTNNCDQDTFLKNVITNPKFLYSAIRSYDSQNVMEEFEKMGLSIKTERGNRVFPSSDKSSDVISALERSLAKKHVKIHLRKKVTGLDIRVKQTEYDEDKYIAGVYCGREYYSADIVVLATGGVSYPLTGATGEAFSWLEQQDIRLEDRKPSLVPLSVEESDCKEMMGLSLRNIEVKFTVKKNPTLKIKKDKLVYSEFGEMIFTHFGVSGPVILSASSSLHRYESSMEKKELILSIDLKPALDEKQLDDRILRDFAKMQNRQFQNALDELLPRKMIPIIVRCSKIDPYKQVNLVTHEERQTLVKLIKSFDFTVLSMRGFDEAIITKGGVSVKEIIPQTMESKVISHLRFAGEMIDCDALTGGFNLQIAWCTAYLAAQ